MLVETICMWWKFRQVMEAEEPIRSFLVFQWKTCMSPLQVNRHRHLLARVRPSAMTLLVMIV